MILVIGFVFMIPFGLISYMVSSFSPDRHWEGTGFPLFFSGFFLFLFPFLYAIFGTIVNVLIGLLYNVLSASFGGIKIELTSLEE
jgi:hypothetical protein